MTKGETKPATKVAKATIYIDVEDEITSIIDKMENAGQKIVALVLPKRASTLQSIVNMRLLKRSADNAAKNVVLITAEEALLPLAGAAGLHVADSLNSKPYIPPLPAGMEKSPAKTAKAAAKEAPVADAEVADKVSDEELPTKIDYKKSIGELAAVQGVDSPETIELGDEEESPEAEAAKATEKLPKSSKDKKIKVPDFDRFRMLMFGGIAAFIALIVFIYLALTVMPKATIAIQTTSSPVSGNLNLTTDPNAKTVDTAKGIIPGFSKSTDQAGTQSVPATGQQNSGNRAKGTMTFYNCNQTDTLEGTDHTVPAGTGVTANGLTYITQDNAKVSPSHYIAGKCQNDQPSSSVDVVAQTGGQKYNQDATTYSVSGYSTISGKGSKITGGTDNIQTVVSQTDVDNAVTKLKGSTATNFVSNFENTLAAQGYYVFVSTLKQADPVTSASPAIGQQASSTTVTIKITYSVLAVKKTDLSQAITAALTKQIDPTKQKLDDNDVISGATIGVSNQSGPATATLNIAEETSAVPIIDTGSLAKKLAGKKSGEISAQINTIPGVKNVSVNFSPFWVSKAPKASKIHITLQHVKSSSDH